VSDKGVVMTSGVHANGRWPPVPRAARAPHLRGTAGSSATPARLIGRVPGWLGELVTDKSFANFAEARLTLYEPEWQI
jgi:hypothetical protein